MQFVLVMQGSPIIKEQPDLDGCILNSNSGLGKDILFAHVGPDKIYYLKSWSKAFSVCHTCLSKKKKFFRMSLNLHNKHPKPVTPHQPVPFLLLQ